MHEKNIQGFRYPKGAFAMLSVYSFTGAAVITSTVFSLLLFLSIDDDPLMKVLFGTLAIIFEAGKFYAWYEFGERRAFRNYWGAFAAFILYFVLAAISIGGSVGGINSATNKAHDYIAIEKAKIAVFDRQIDAIEKQIELNNLAGQKYIEMKLIANGVTRIQAQNNKLREEQIRLATERDSLPPIKQGSAIGLIASIADTFTVSQQIAQFGLVVFLSILLDLFAAFFVGVIGEEHRFRYAFVHRNIFDIQAQELNKPLEYLENQTDCFYEQNHNNQDDAIKTKADEIEKTPLSLPEQVKNALNGGIVICSKKAVAKHFHLASDEVNELFDEMMSMGVVAKKANHHYYLLGSS